jgi:pimeloyl-ACP methyl ester carboxylesterase
MGEGYVEVEKGTRLWYRDQGRGPALVFQNGVGVTITFWYELAERFARRGYRTVLWDYRGHGLSDPPQVPELTLEECTADLLKVLDHLRIEKAVLAGHSMGAQLGFEFYRRHAGRVAALVPTLGTYRNAVSSFFDMPRVAPRVFAVGDFLAYRVPRLMKGFTAFAAAQPGLSDAVVRRLRIVHPTLSPREWLPSYLEHMKKLDPRVFFSLARAVRDHDASEVLPTIHVPTLVIAGERDFFCPPRVAREMAEHIPGAELFIVPGGSHAAIIEQPELFDARLARFLEERVRPTLRSAPEARA